MGILVSVLKNYLKYGFDINTPSRTWTTPQQISQPNPLKIERSKKKSKLKQKIIVAQNFLILISPHITFQRTNASPEKQNVFCFSMLGFPMKSNMMRHCDIWSVSQLNHLPGLTRPPSQKWNSLLAWKQHRAHGSPFSNEGTELTLCLWWRF